jgi:hypothetical protein
VILEREDDADFFGDFDERSGVLDDERQLLVQGWIRRKARVNHGIRAILRNLDVAKFLVVVELLDALIDRPLCLVTGGNGVESQRRHELQVPLGQHPLDLGEIARIVPLANSAVADLQPKLGRPFDQPLQRLGRIQVNRRLGEIRIGLSVGVEAEVAPIRK